MGDVLGSYLASLCTLTRLYGDNDLLEVSVRGSEVWPGSGKDSGVTQGEYVLTREKVRGKHRRRATVVAVNCTVQKGKVPSCSMALSHIPSHPSPPYTHHHPCCPQVVMGDKAGEVEGGTDLQELVANEDYDELVGARGRGPCAGHEL